MAYLDPSTAERVDGIAKALHSNRSNAIRHLVECALDGKPLGV